MLWAAAEDGSRVLATRYARAVCPNCRAGVIAKCGEIVTHHWAHERRDDCDIWSEAESDWHVRLKQYFPDDWQEVRMGEHRADVRTARGVVVEMQRSPIAPETIREREAFYGPMVWVVEASRFDLHFRRRENYYVFHWKHPAKSWWAARRPLFFDLGMGLLFRVGALYDEIPCSGWGKLVSLAGFAAHYGGTVEEALPNVASIEETLTLRAEVDIACTVGHWADAALAPRRPIPAGNNRDMWVAAVERGDEAPLAVAPPHVSDPVSWEWAMWVGRQQAPADDFADWPDVIPAPPAAGTAPAGDLEAQGAWIERCVIEAGAKACPGFGSTRLDCPACPECGGPMWDNRGSKRNPRAPDFRCKDQPDCPGVIWPNETARREAALRVSMQEAARVAASRRAEAAGRWALAEWDSWYTPQGQEMLRGVVAWLDSLPAGTAAAVVRAWRDRLGEDAPLIFQLYHLARCDRARQPCEPQEELSYA